MPVDITMDNFESEVRQSPIPVLAYFHLPSCAKCMVFGSFSEGLEARNQGRFKLAKFNIMQNQKLAKELGVGSAPSFLVFKNGQPVEAFLGDQVNKDTILSFMDHLDPGQTTHPDGG